MHKMFIKNRILHPLARHIICKLPFDPTPQLPPRRFLLIFRQETDGTFSSYLLCLRSQNKVPAEVMILGGPLINNDVIIYNGTLLMECLSICLI
jgi:hypothetical protein